MISSRTPAERGARLSFEFDGAEIHAFDGETLAAALLASGVPAFGVTRAGEPRMPLCNMGTCFDCAVTVDGRLLVRACVTDARAGMVVEHNEGC